MLGAAGVRASAIGPEADLQNFQRWRRSIELKTKPNMCKRRFPPPDLSGRDFDVVEEQPRGRT